METTKTKLNAMLSQTANAMMDYDTWQWPPQCSVFFYQPARPQQMRKENKNPVEREEGEI